MSVNRTRAALVSALLLTGTALSAPAATSAASERPHRHPTSSESAQVVLDWERTAFSTVYPVTPIPVGVPLLGYTSIAMHQAVEVST